MAKKEKGLLVTVSRLLKNEAKTVSLFFEDEQQGRLFCEQNKTFVIHKQLVGLVRKED